MLLTCIIPCKFYKFWIIYNKFTSDVSILFTYFGKIKSFLRANLKLITNLKNTFIVTSDIPVCVEILKSDLFKFSTRVFECMERLITSLVCLKTLHAHPFICLHCKISMSSVRPFSGLSPQFFWLFAWSCISKTSDEVWF